MEVTAGNYDLANLVNTDPAKIRLAQFEEELRRRINDQALKVYGITVLQVGLERITLPDQTLVATIERMKAERSTVAAERSAEGNRIAAQIQSDADRDSRVIVAQAKADVADIQAKARVDAAAIIRRRMPTIATLHHAAFLGFA